VYGWQLYHRQGSGESPPIPADVIMTRHVFFFIEGQAL
jgi:hypothetical protein